MTSVLLDTEVFIFAVMAPERLSPTARQICASPDYALHVSVATLWEILIKVSTGKLPLPEPVDWFTRHMRHLAASPLAIRLADVQVMASLPWIHKDPFDRVIIAQSRTSKYPLVTCDQQIRRYEVEAIW